MKNIFAIFGILATALGTTSCASRPISVRECKTIDWASLGKKMGTEGYPNSHPPTRYQSCTELGQVSTQKQYQKGYEVGLQEFCTPSTLYRWIRNGANYQGQCSHSQKAEIARAVRLGTSAQEKQAELNQSKSQLSGLQSRLVSAQAYERSNLTFQKGRIEEKISSLEKDLSLLEYR